MTVIEIIDAFTFYGLDVMCLAALTFAVVQLCKLTFLKKLNRKLITFLPFFFGTVFYAVYAGLKNMSFEYLLQNYVSVIEHGISVGAAATLAYVLYEQFIREKKTSLSATEGVISALIEGYVPTDEVEKVAKAIAEAIAKDVTGGGAQRAAEILSASAGENVTERDVQLLSKLIIEALAHVNV